MFDGYPDNLAIHKILLAIFVAILTTGTVRAEVSSSLRSEANSGKEERDQLLLTLYQNGYFKNASCREFANYMLEKLGLPAIGDATPIKGRRGSFNRDGALADAPSLSDSIYSNDASRSEVKISMGAEKSKKRQWSLLVERSFIPAIRKEGKVISSPRLSVKSRFVFDLEPNQGRTTCELKSLFVAIMNRDQKQKAADELKEISLNECLDTFLIEDNSHLDKVSAEGQGLFREICADAVHYSGEAKNRLKVIKTKKN